MDTRVKPAYDEMRRPQLLGASYGNIGFTAPVLIDIDDRGVAQVILNRPERNNAYDGDLIQALLERARRTGKSQTGCAPPSSAAPDGISRPAPI